jgi:hypothetical protein
LLLFIAQVPAVMMDRFARLNHGFDDSRSCSSFALDKPKACLAGSADSQSAAAWEQLISNLLCFFLNTLVGSISDQYGRKSKLPFVVMYRLMQYLISHFHCNCRSDFNSWPVRCLAAAVVFGSVTAPSPHGSDMVLCCWIGDRIDWLGISDSERTF